MSRHPVVLNLGHALIASAWADGHLDEEEIQGLKDLLFRLPGLRPEDWAELRRRAEFPVDEEERRRLIDGLAHSIQDEEDRRLVLQALDELLRSDGHLGEAERSSLEEIRRAVQAERPAAGGGWSSLLGLLRGRLQRRAEAAAAAFRPQSRQEDLHQALYAEVGERLDEAGAPPEVDGDELKRLCLAGGLLAHVALVDGHVDEGEREAMVAALRDGWQLEEPAARAVVEVMVIRGGGRLDLHRALREFFELTTEAERISFLDVLFAVAAADGAVSREESEEIRLLAMGLKLSNVHFIAARTRIPEDQREL